MKFPHGYEHAYQNALRQLEHDYERLGSFEKVADQLGVSKGLVYKVMRKGYKPLSGKINQMLGLPEIHMVPMILCQSCNKPQFTQLCKCKPKKSPRMEKKKPAKPKRIRVDIDPEMLSKKEIKAIRDLDKETRTKFLALLAGYDLHGEEDE